MDFSRRLVDIGVIYRKLRNSAKKRGIEFNLSLNYLNEMELPFRCCITGELIDYSGVGRNNPNGYSYDRIDNTKGYIDGNLYILSVEGNRKKSSLSISEVENIKSYLDDKLDSKLE